MNILMGLSTVSIIHRECLAQSPDRVLDTSYKIAKRSLDK